MRIIDMTNCFTGLSLSFMLIWILFVAQPCGAFDPFNGPVITHEDSLLASAFWKEGARNELGSRGPDFGFVLEALKRAIEYHSFDLELHQLRFDVLQRVGSRDELLAAISEALVYFPCLTELWEKKARILLETGEIERANVALDSLLTIDPKRLDIWLQKLELYRNTGYKKRAYVAVSRALELAPDREDLWSEKKSLCLFFDDLDACLRFFESRIEAFPDKKDYRLEYITYLENHRLPLKADSVYQKLLERWPEDERRWEERSHLLARNEKWDEYLSAVNRNIAAQPDNVRMRIEKLSALERSGLLAEMESETLEIFKRDTKPLTREFVYSSLGNAYLRVHQWQKALQIANRAIAEFPKSGWTWYLRGQLGKFVDRRIEQQLSDLDSAIIRYGVDSKGLPAYPDAYLRKCIVLRDAGQLEEALAIVEDLLAKKDNWPRVWRIKGVLLNELGRPEEALDCLEKELKNYPNDKVTLGLQRLIRQKVSEQQKR